MNPGKKEKRPKRKRPPPQNPIEAAIREWAENLRRSEDSPSTTTDTATTDAWDVDLLVSQAPRRWTVYPPMVLLPAGSFGSAAPAWQHLLASLASLGPAGRDKGEQLWRGILARIQVRAGPKTPLTHLAVNEGIPLVDAASPAPLSPNGAEAAEWNKLRSPGGLRMLFGDFGPATWGRAPSGNDAAAAAEEEEEEEEEEDEDEEEDDNDNNPGQSDFDAAFWVSTTQNGIRQTWAPRWTMFSRGNVKEKARLLEFHSPPSSSSSSETAPTPTLAHRIRPSPSLHNQRTWAADLYAGIGYFAFSYAALGLRVLCWELNPWSVEALRRGAEMNGWSTRVVRDREELHSLDEEGGGALLDLVRGGGSSGGGGPPPPPPQIIVFQEDNARAEGRVRALRGACREEDALPVLHVNCGLLPTSTGSWDGAWDIAMSGGGGGGGKAWLHLHENVGVEDIQTRKGEIERFFQGKQTQVVGGGGNDGNTDTKCWVDHVELVKTYAPGVWHCVYDLYIVTSNR